MTEQRPCALAFELDAESGRLVARFDPVGEPAAPDRETVIAALDRAGWSALHRDDEAIGQLVALATAANEPVELAIAERRDARWELEVVDDAMSVLLHISPPYGGEPVSRAQVDQTLAAAEVVAGVLDDAIDQAVAQQQAHGLEVARGSPARPGTPARFRSLIPEMRKRGPTVDARGIADYRELGTLVIVHAGDPLMRRTPAQPGTAGYDVHGRIVPAPAADDPPFSPTLSGARVSDDDPELLIAEISGQPLLLPHGVTVEPTITVATVDLASGNIDFDGTVNVTGDVASGMHVKATGDVLIGGMVEAATIEAGGDITVAAGAIGLAGGAQRHDGSHRARIVAQGTASVMFCENAEIRSHADILIGEVSLHSELTANRHIIIGKPGGRRSQLIGGFARAGAQLKVGTLGSSAGVHTRVEIGYDPQIRSTVGSLEQAVRESEAKLDNLRQVLDYTSSRPDARHQQLCERARQTLAATEQSHAELLARLAEAEARLTLSENARIVVGQSVHSGVDMQLGSRPAHFREDASGGVFELVDGEICNTGK